MNMKWTKAKNKANTENEWAKFRHVMLPQS